MKKQTFCNLLNRDKQDEKNKSTEPQLPVEKYEVV